MIIIDCIQGEDAWFAEKLGKLSASNASKLITSTYKASTSRKGYLHTIVAEKLTGTRYDVFKTPEMEEGNNREDESRKLYEMLSGDTITEVGVVYPDKDKKYLCSPDGICEEKQYGLELKNVMPKTMVGYLLDNKVDTKYIVQIQFSLMVTGFEYWMYMAYCPEIKPLIIKVERDEKMIDLLRQESEKFCEEAEKITAQLKEKK